MSRRAERRQAAAAGMRATLDDPALAEAMTQVAQIGRLSDGDIHAMREARRRNLGAAGMVALVFAVGIGGWHQGWFAPAAPLPQHFETPRGQQLNVELADGTRLRLNGATSVDVTLGDKGRRVQLRQGEVYFDVAHEPKRPFTVEAGGSATQVLGTAFDLDMLGGDVRLSVYRGKVRFGAGANAVEVPAGFRTRLEHGTPRTPERFDAAQQDWRQDWLDTDEMRLGELVVALNRRGGPMVAAPPPGLARIPVSGRFKLDNPRQLLEAIGGAYGFSVVRDGNQLRLVEGANGDAKPTSR
ncbi:FecR domain-containing protein [Sphingomonas sp.]|uniref:FecR family protein n=1 Tax=Sphingomonas sp. TaxID=28214 RepID=UPI001B265029|nr:FecR domain-containing protein [Sphingomonas sp.]MBO9712305.1 FecR domain-containing protein [Sphingomonas sp.]